MQCEQHSTPNLIISSSLNAVVAVLRIVAFCCCCFLLLLFQLFADVDETDQARAAAAFGVHLVSLQFDIRRVLLAKRISQGPTDQSG